LPIDPRHYSRIEDPHASAEALCPLAEVLLPPLAATIAGAGNLLE
jgi:hypothetical protein